MSRVSIAVLLLRDKNHAISRLPTATTSAFCVFINGFCHHWSDRINFPFADDMSGPVYGLIFYYYYYRQACA